MILMNDAGRGQAAGGIKVARDSGFSVMSDNRFRLLRIRWIMK
jgi:hypothetical protein